MSKKPGVFYINSILSVIAILFVINTLELPGHTLIKQALATVGGAITGEGTINKIARFAGASGASNSIGDSVIYEDATGKIGIGTITPQTTLEIDSTDGNGIRLVNTGSSNKRWSFVGGGNDLHIDETGVLNVMTLQAGGNVGIGTATPQYKLDVNGTINATAVLVNGSAITGGGGQWTTSGVNIYNNNSGGVTIGAATAPTTGYLMRVVGNLELTGATPTINASSYITFPSGAFFNSGIVYTEASLRARGGINNDTGTYLTIAGGTSGYTYFSGNVGIGTTTPGYLLEVNGTSKFNNNVGIATVPGSEKLTVSGAIKIAGASSANPTSALQFDYQAGRGRIMVYGADSSTLGKLQIATYSAGATIGGEIMTFDTTGNVGIGTTTPRTILEITKDSTGGSLGTYPVTILNNPNATGYAAYLLYNGVTQVGGLQKSTDNSLLLYTAPSTPITFATAGTEKMRILSNGNVGIGTTTPNARLEIVSKPANNYGDGIVIGQVNGDNTNSIQTYIDDGAGGGWATRATYNAGNANPLYIQKDGGDLVLGNARGISSVGKITAPTFVGALTGNATSASSVPWSGITSVPSTVYTSAARPGPTRLYRSDSDSDYSLQTNWNTPWGGYWGLRGYSGGTLHAEVAVGYSAIAGTANAVSFNGGLTTGSSPTFTDVYANSWFRNSARTGIYNQTYGTHFYTDSASVWRMSSNNGLMLNSTAGHDSAPAGYVYHDGTGFGMLNNAGSWMFYSPANNTDVYFPSAGYWMSTIGSWLNQSVRSGANPTFGTVYAALSGNAASATIASTVSIYTNRTDGAWYQAMWTTSGSTTLYSTANVTIRSSAYGGVGFNGSAWYIEGNASYGLYSNTGFYAAGGLWDAGNRVCSAATCSIGGTGISAASFTDANNGGYYMDPDGSTRMNYMGRNYGWNWTEYDWNNTAFYMDLDQVSILNDLRVNILYDRYNTSYYLDPHSTSVLNVLYSNTYYYSDINLKKNILPLKNGLSSILALQGVTFDWKDTGKSSIGLIAQDVEKVFPEAVRADEKTGMKGINESVLIAPMIEAIKEVNSRVSDLVAKVDGLIAKIDGVIAQVADLYTKYTGHDAQIKVLEAERLKQNTALATQQKEIDDMKISNKNLMDRLNKLEKSNKTKTTK